METEDETTRSKDAILHSCLKRLLPKSFIRRLARFAAFEPKAAWASADQSAVAVAVGSHSVCSEAENTEYLVSCTSTQEIMSYAKTKYISRSCLWCDSTRMSATTSLRRSVSTVLSFPSISSLSQRPSDRWGRPGGSPEAF